MGRKCINLVDQRFGRLLVIKRNGLKNGSAQWDCLCACGKIKTIDGHSLRNGNSNSCGCLCSEISSQKAKNQGLPFGEAAFNCLYSDYRAKARKRNFEFSLSKEEFYRISKQNCYYCNCVPSQIYRNHSKNKLDEYVYNGIDRINSNLGYTIDNVLPCCGVCNQAKSNKKYKDFIEWIKTVYKNISNKEQNE